ncbi:WD repeat-containing protein 74 [Camellia lanceoleosa]|uniref:WD repeat-containing protein 74 n=1 Tax=Camellia lanceoleosa TaxID=1840588 RepID=A0ACC0I208_9ERIC|nr:WD repeat-containing protein 74 [Camellia lanceoleosa]
MFVFPLPILLLMIYCLKIMPLLCFLVFAFWQHFDPSRSCTVLTCTTKGHASMRSVEIPKSPQDSISSVPPTAWNICATGNILCSKVDGNENYALFGGKGVEVNVWDLDTCTKIWNAKSPAKNSLGIFTPSWFTCATFLSKDDHRKFAAGTNSHQVHLYDISAQRRSVLSFDFREFPIKAVAKDLDGNTIYIGNGSGSLASVDLRTGKLLGCFLGKCSGSIRSIARHPELPVLASCGLDSYLHLWDVESRQLLSAVFLKQHLTNVVFDSNFSGEVDQAHGRNHPTLAGDKSGELLLNKGSKSIRIQSQIRALGDAESGKEKRGGMARQKQKAVSRGGGSSSMANWHKGPAFRVAASVLARQKSLGHDSVKNKVLIAEAMETVKMGKALGIDFLGKEEEVVRKIVELEEEDASKAAQVAAGD